MIRRLLALLALLLLALPAYAALQGSDTKPGDACSAGEAGHTRRNASATQDPTEITLICNGSQWVSANSGGTLKGTNVTGACTPALDGTIKYNAAATPAWQYCDGGTTSWLPFKLPQCADDDTGECTLSALRTSSDPQFLASNIRCGSKLLGITGTYGSGSSSAFTFTDVTNAAVSTLTTASAVTVSGIPSGCPGDVFVSGDGSPQVSINGGAWGTTGSITNGQTLAVRLTSSASLGTTSTATVSIGSTDSAWSVTTLAADTTPDTYTFTDVTGAELSTLTTATAITISGINTSTPVSVTGTGAQISINGGAWGTSGNITNGQTLAVRLTSSSAHSTALSATVTVGSVTETWLVTTRALNNCSAESKTWLTNCTATLSAAAHGANGTATISDPGGCGTAYYGSGMFSCADGTFTYSSGTCTQQTACDTTPNAFAFTDQTGIALSTLTTSNTLTISGINTTTPVSVSGGGSPKISINGGAWGTSGSINNGQSLRVQLTSSASGNTAVTATVTVGGASDIWSVTTQNTNGTWTYSGSSASYGLPVCSYTPYSGQACSPIGYQCEIEGVSVFGYPEFALYSCI